METLNDILQFYSEDPQKWQYYDGMNLTLKGVLNDPNKALELIKGYFNTGEKGEVFIDHDIKNIMKTF